MSEINRSLGVLLQRKIMFEHGMRLMNVENMISEPSPSLTDERLEEILNEVAKVVRLEQANERIVRLVQENTPPPKPEPHVRVANPKPEPEPEPEPKPEPKPKRRTRRTTKKKEEE